MEWTEKGKPGIMRFNSWSRTNVHSRQRRNYIEWSFGSSKTQVREMTDLGRMDVYTELKYIFRKMKTLNEIKCWSMWNFYLEIVLIFILYKGYLSVATEWRRQHFLQTCILRSLAVPYFGLSYEMSIFSRINDSKLLKIIYNCHPYQQHFANFNLI